jgi:hypothetical protein
MGFERLEVCNSWQLKTMASYACGSKGAFSFGTRGNSAIPEAWIRVARLDDFDCDQDYVFEAAPCCRLDHSDRKLDRPCSSISSGRTSITRRVRW